MASIFHIEDLASQNQPCPPKLVPRVVMYWHSPMSGLRPWKSPKAQLPKPVCTWPSAVSERVLRLPPLHFASLRTDKDTPNGEEVGTKGVEVNVWISHPRTLVVVSTRAALDYRCKKSHLITHYTTNSIKLKGFYIKVFHQLLINEVLRDCRSGSD